VAAQYRMRRRKLAIVLLDIIGSTAFVQRYGAVRAAQHFQFHDELARRLMYKFGGREIDRSDGFLVSFDSAIDAVNFGLHYQASVPKKTRLNTRIGIHWGEVVEVEQHELWVDAGAKSIELEGLAKNIAARTMSLCGAGQVLLTKEAYSVVRGRVNKMTPAYTKYACVGVYRFKGVREPLEIYAVGVDEASLQPPAGNDKVKRLGGPKYIKVRARDRRIKEWAVWFYKRLAFLAILFWIYVLLWMLATPLGRDLLGIPSFRVVEDILKYLQHLYEVAQHGR
jgi:class 3 adenylate cyclase